MLIENFLAIPIFYYVKLKVHKLFSNLFNNFID